MYVSYTAPGPAQVGRSGSYDALEVQFDFEDYSAYIVGLNRDDETWHEIAHVQRFDGQLLVTSKERDLDLDDVTAIWIEDDR